MSSGSAVNDRVVATLDALTRRPPELPWGVRELAEDLGLSRSTVHRTLHALAERDLATQTANATYVCGPRLRVLADRLHRSHLLLGQARPLAEELARACDATILLSLYDPVRTGGFVTLSAIPDGPVRYRLDPGAAIPLHAGAAGRAMLAALGPDVLARLDLVAHTPDTVTDVAELERLLHRAREDGVTISVGQHVALAAGVAAPFHAAGLLGAVSATRPRHETRHADLERFAPLVRETALRIGNLTAPAPRPAPEHGRAAPTSPIPTEDGGSATARTERLISALTASAPLPLGGRALARVLRGNPATATRLLDTALATGLATTHEQHAVAGPLLLRWAAALGPLHSIAPIVFPALRDLARQTGETIGLTEYDPATRTARMTAVVPGSKPIHYDLPTGSDVPLAAGAAGKAILAFLPDDTLPDLPLVAYTERTPLHRTAIEKDLAQVRDHGWAVGDGERIPDGYGIAVPYFAQDTVAGSLTATIPRHRADEIDVDAVRTRLSAAALSITRLLSV
ncbi:IclR family transcriptional regulator [Streptomyces sedi]|uniref:IclR family transcriptional regulator n=1 Tax=Streptomyces sedi TaxID=555059 RepID=UPI001476E4FF|nr:IclR family transcriptional regulator C-terminal domain-containing protein [Streptomyces sedi]